MRITVRTLRSICASEVAAPVVTLDHTPTTQAQRRLGNRHEYGEGDVATAGAAMAVFPRSHPR